MESLYYDIGALRVQIFGKKSLNWLKRSEAFQPFETKGNNPTDCRIYLDNNSIISPVTEKIHSFFIQDQTPCLFGKSDGCYVFEMMVSANRTAESAMRFRFDDEHTVYATQMYSPFHLMFGLWMAFNWLAASRGKVCIHSSCISLHGKSILFLGESGSGKSTQSRLWMECFPDAKLLNDDGPILSENQGCYHAYGSPWSGKTACYKQEHYPVKAFVKVVQAEKNIITPLSPAAAIAPLLAAFPPALCRLQELADNYIGTVDGLLKHANVYRLECTPDKEAALLCYKTIFEKP